MKLLVFLVLISETLSYYHNDVGIPEASRIKEAEETGLLRVTGGEITNLGTYPFFAGLVIAVDVNATSVCGSSLISNTKLVTAAHCWFDGETNALLFEVVLGSTTLFSGGKRIRTRDVLAHEDFDIEIVQNDIAIITVPNIEFSDLISPINLAKDGGDIVGIKCQIVGFGRTSEDQAVTMEQQLSQAFTTVISNEECSSLYGELITASSICTSGLNGRGPCGGDSGGPVFYGDEDYRDEEFVLIGVVSFGSSHGCDAGHPSSHTRISAYLQWIVQRM